jgi:hypothetical protein
MILALSRGFVLNYHSLTSFAIPHAHADGDGGGDGGGGGGDGGGGAGDGGGDGGGSAGDGSGGDGGGGAGDGSGGDGGGGAGDTGGDTGGGPSDIPGCTNPTATNYNPSATTDNGSCVFSPPSISAVCTANGTLTVSGSPATPPAGTTYALRVDDLSTPWQFAGTCNGDIGGGDFCSNSITSFPVSGQGVQGHSYDIWAHVLSSTGVFSAAVHTSVSCPAAPPPPVCVLSVSPTTVTAGDSATFSWSTQNATSLVLDQGIGALDVHGGSVTITPTANLSVVGTVTGPGGTATCRTSITVTQPQPPKPVCTLLASPTAIQTGSSSSLSWTTTNATSFSIDQGIGSVTPANAGSKSVSPTSSITYTGTATGAGGTATCTATVTVSTLPPPPPAPICTLTASPASIQTGGTSSLSWTTQNATSFSINHSIGSVTPVASGSKSVSPTATITYTGTVTGSGGTATCTATIAVNAPPPPAPTCVLTAAPASIQTGSSSTLSWTTTNATSFSINHSIGSVTPVASGSTSVSPTATTQYTGTATGAGGTVTCHATVTVTTTPPSVACTLTASPTSVNPGDHTTLTWTATNPNTFTIDNGIGQVTPSIGGSVQSHAINADTTFTGTVVSPTGQVATCTAAVTIIHGGGGGGPSCVLTATPSSIPSGGSSTIAWGGTGIASVDVDNGVVTATTTIPGSAVVHLTTVQTYTYTGTFHATTGQTLTCSATLTVTGGGGGGGCSGNCGGGGGGSPPPTVTLAALPHVNSQPLAYLYLSQIPYTGLDLGPVGTMMYWLVLLAFSLALAYLVLFSAVPYASRSMQAFGTRVIDILNSEKFAPAPVVAHAAPVRPLMPAPARSLPSVAASVREVPRAYSTYDGFKSFAQKGALSIDDIVKGLTRETHTHTVQHVVETPNVEPIYANVEPVPLPEEPKKVGQPTPPPTLPEPEPLEVSVPADVKGFTSALLEGDRLAVFAGLRQHMRGGGAAERLISAVACLIDDAYRARIDGTPADADIARLAARFSTPTLEKLVASLTTAIDASYSVDVTGAKLALTRALATLGA